VIPKELPGLEVLSLKLKLGEGTEEEELPSAKRIAGWEIMAPESIRAFTREKNKKERGFIGDITIMT
jgi:hypothetical protein